MMQPNIVLLETEVVAAQTAPDKELVDVLVGFAKSTGDNKIIRAWEEYLFNYVKQHAADIEDIHNAFVGAFALALFTGWKAGVAQAESVKLEELLSLPTE